MLRAEGSDRMRTRPLAVVVGAAIIALPLIGTAQDSLPPRTFSQFVGTWVLDESASTGRLEMAPPVARTLSIATTPEAVTLTKVFSLPPELPGREANASGPIIPRRGVSLRRDGNDSRRSTSAEDGLSLLVQTRR
jgi:hypothetical protein